jgi:hypothetical protein
MAAPKICDVPTPVKRAEAEIYRSLRDRLVHMHCDRKDHGHRCAGAITITATDITLQCKLCGDCRRTLQSDA